MTILPVGKDPITIQEARDWYNTASDKGARSSVSIFHNRLVYWDGAQNTHLGNGTPIVSVPLFYNYRKPISIAQDAPFIESEGKLPLLAQRIDDLQLTKRLLISKDGKGGYRSCVMLTIPTDEYRKANATIMTATFVGSQLYYTGSEVGFLLGMQYDKGHLTNVFRANSTKKTHSSCYKAIYQSTSPNQIDGIRTHLAGWSKQLKLPMLFQDKVGTIYSLVDIVHIDRKTGTVGSPLTDSPNQEN